MNIKSKTCALFLAAVMVAAVGAANLSYATSTQDELNNVNQEREEISSDLEAVAERIKAQQAEIEEIEESIDIKESQIEETLSDIEKTKSDIKDRKENLDNRLRAMYKNGSVGYLDVLLGSGSLSELISNIDMVQKIYRNDQKTLETLKNQHEELGSKQVVLEEQQADLETERISAQKKQDELKADQSVLKEKHDELEAESQRLSSEIASGQDSDKVYEGGTFKWPTTSYYITSEFGYRYHPIFGDWRGHSGVDIGAGHGQPVYAAADGKVMFSGGNPDYGYGYYITIDHGSGLATLYGHNSQLLVSHGQEVKKGDVIAKIGSTGWSTGPHLHFEVIVNGTPVNPMNYF